MRARALKGMEEGVYSYRLNGSFFDLQRLNAKTKYLYQLIQEALFANVVLSWHTYSDLQMMFNYFSEASKAFGLTIVLS